MPVCLRVCVPRLRLQYFLAGLLWIAVTILRAFIMDDGQHPGILRVFITVDGQHPGFMPTDKYGFPAPDEGERQGMTYSL